MVSLWDEPSDSRETLVAYFWFLYFASKQAHKNLSCPVPPRHTQGWASLGYNCRCAEESSNSGAARTQSLAQRRKLVITRTYRWASKVAHTSQPSGGFHKSTFYLCILLSSCCETWLWKVVNIEGIDIEHPRQCILENLKVFCDHKIEASLSKLRDDISTRMMKRKSSLSMKGKQISVDPHSWNWKSGWFV